MRPKTWVNAALIDTSKPIESDIHEAHSPQIAISAVSESNGNEAAVYE